MDGLWTNRNSLSDFVMNGLDAYKSEVYDVYVAVAFFTEPDVIQSIADSGCHIRIIVRLGFPTNPSALKKIMKNKNVEVRYYSDHSFHPKLYIFGDKSALLGSANLTRSALLTNQEVVVSIDSEDQRFSELISLFSDYWDEAKVLTNCDLEKYDSIFSRYSKSIKDLDNFDGEVISKIGKTVFPNINRGKTAKSKENIFLDNYRKTYQESVAAFEEIKKIYESTNKRKVNNNLLPLRVEIDSFFSFVRDTYATHETWRERPLGWSDINRCLALNQIDEWIDTPWHHFDSTIVLQNYPLITKTFSSPKSISSSSFNDIIEALTVLHSFHDRLRFYPGGLVTLQNSFKNNNKIDKVKDSLIYLLHGKGDIVQRMANLIYDREYKLNEFGQANAQELVGWINKEDLPVINGRTTKVLRYYGFNVRQL